MASSIFIKNIIENKKHFSDEKLDNLLNIYCQMTKEVAVLNKMFPDRKFVVAKNLLESVGEAIAINRYGISFDNKKDNNFPGSIYSHPVQLRIVRQDEVKIHFYGAEVPIGAYLLVLYMDENGQFFEVYNGSFSMVWDSINKSDKLYNKHVELDKLRKIQSNRYNMPRLDSYPRVIKWKK